MRWRLGYVMNSIAYIGAFILLGALLGSKFIVLVSDKAGTKPANTRPSDTRAIERSAEMKTRYKAEEIRENEFKQDADSKMAATCRPDPQHTKLTKSLYYCPISKIASEFTIWLMDKIPHCTTSQSCWQRTGYSGEEFSFMWAREPYGRLFSAYEDKLFRPNNFWRTIGIPVIKKVRVNASEKSLKIGHDVTFAELVNYVLKVTADGTTMNGHLHPMYTACNPCESHFDYVGKLESFGEGIDYVCGQLVEMGFITDKSQCNDVRPENRLLGRTDMLYETLEKHHESFSSIEHFKMLQRTWKSYQIRGLVSKTIEMPLMVEAGRIKRYRFRNALAKALSASTNRTQLKAQREEALIQAYMTVPLEDMEKLKDFVEKDCLIFGYDLRPAALFQPRDGYHPDYDYFDGLK